jgi:hypothetical protein
MIVPGDRVSAIPSVKARAVAFVTIVISGLLGAVIGAGFAGIGCTGSCVNQQGVGALFGAAAGAGGISVVAVLALRAMAEWRAGPGAAGAAGAADQVGRADQIEPEADAT